MKGLIYIPEEPELACAYAKFHAGQVTFNDLLTYSQWIRFDPRLGELWLIHFAKVWKTIPSVLWQKQIINLPWPQVIGVLLEQFQKLFLESSEERKIFALFKRIVLFGVAPVSPQDFFIGLKPLRLNSGEHEVNESLWAFQKWGFFGLESFVNKESERLKKKPQTLLSAANRLKILDALLLAHSRITVSDYLNALSYRVHRRVAEKDLKNCTLLKPVGKTRARFFVVISK